MKLLAIDPSITRSGYAVMTAADTLVECGLLKPKPASSPAIMRIDDLANDVFALGCSVKPDEIVIEAPTHHVNHGRPGAGLTVYGMAVGAAWVASRFALRLLCSRDGAFRPVLSYDERVWTRGRPKPERQRNIMIEFPDYYWTKDPGGDIADAIGLGQFRFCTRVEAGNSGTSATKLGRKT